MYLFLSECFKMFHLRQSWELLCRGSWHPPWADELWCHNTHNSASQAVANQNAQVPRQRLGAANPGGALPGAASQGDPKVSLLRKDSNDENLSLRPSSPNQKEEWKSLTIWRVRPSMPGQTPGTPPWTCHCSRVLPSTSSTFWSTAGSSHSSGSQFGV